MLKTKNGAGLYVITEVAKKLDLPIDKVFYAVSDNEIMSYKFDKEDLEKLSETGYEVSKDVIPGIYLDFCGIYFLAHCFKYKPDLKDKVIEWFEQELALGISNSVDNKLAGELASYASDLFDILGEDIFTKTQYKKKKLVRKLIATLGGTIDEHVGFGLEPQSDYLTMDKMESEVLYDVIEMVELGYDISPYSRIIHNVNILVKSELIIFADIEERV